MIFKEVSRQKTIRNGRYHMSLINIAMLENEFLADEEDSLKDANILQNKTIDLQINLHNHAFIYLSKGVIPMPSPISLKSIIDEFDMLFDDMTVYLNKKTGELISLSNEDYAAIEGGEDPEMVLDMDDDMIEKAKDVVNTDDYLALPDKYEIHEYKIMEDFCYSIDDGKIRDDLAGKIRGSGAFGRFKDAINRYCIQQKWYDYRYEKLKEIVIGWLEDHDLKYTP